MAFPLTSTPFGRYLVVTAVATPANVAAFVAMERWTGWHPAAANTVSALALAAPTMLAYKRWVWSSDTTVSMQREVVPFIIMTLLSIAAAVGTLSLVSAAGAPQRVITYTPLMTYTAIWLARFFVLGWLFGERERTTATPAVVDSFDATAVR